MTIERGYPVPTLSDYIYIQVMEAQLVGISNLLAIARKSFGELSLYQPYFYYKGQKYRFYFDVRSNKQKFERAT
jgi:hypothetical protein